MVTSGSFVGSAALVLAVTLLAMTSPSVSAGLSSGAPRGSAGTQISWGPAEVVADTAYPSVGLPAVVRVRTGGSAVAAWLADTQSSERPLMVARRRSDGRWTNPQQLVAPSSGLTNLDVAVGPPGFASVVWRKRVGDRWRVEESHLRGGTWTPVQALGAGAGPPRVTIDGRGTTTVVWAGRGIRSARLGRSGSWRFDRVAGPVTAVRLAVGSNADGDLVVAWLHGALVSASLRPHGAMWGGTRTWAPNPRDHPSLTGLQTAIGAEGRALVVWSTSDVWREAQREYANYVAWARSTTSGTWSPSRKLTSSLGEDGSGLTLSMNGSGAALASWYQMLRSDQPSRVWAARFRQDGTWGVPLRVSWSAAHRPNAFMDRRGKAHVVMQNGRRVLAFKQPPGRPWDAGRVIATGDLFEATGRGTRLIALYDARFRDGLRARAWSSAG